MITKEVLDSLKVAVVAGVPYMGDLDIDGVNVTIKSAHRLTSPKGTITRPTLNTYVKKFNKNELADLSFQNVTNLVTRDINEDEQDVIDAVTILIGRVEKNLPAELFNRYFDKKNGLS